MIFFVPLNRPILYKYCPVPLTLPSLNLPNGGNLGLGEVLLFLFNEISDYFLLDFYFAFSSRLYSQPTSHPPLIYYCRICSLYRVNFISDLSAMLPANLDPFSHGLCLALFTQMLSTCLDKHAALIPKVPFPRPCSRWFNGDLFLFKQVMRADEGNFVKVCLIDTIRHHLYYHISPQRTPT